MVFPFIYLVLMFLPIGIIIYFVSKYLKTWQSIENKKIFQEQQNLQWQQQQAGISTRLQAYERWSVFCDRIAVVALLERTDYTQLNAQQLQYALNATIRQEYIYNSPQALHISDNAVEMLRILRESTLDVIASIAQTVSTESGQKLAECLLRQAAAPNLLMVEKTKEALRTEVSHLLNYK